MGWRRRDFVKRCQQPDEPGHGVDGLDGKLHGGEEEGEQADVPSYGKGPEGAEVAAVFECDQAEGDDDGEDGFFMDVPAKEEGGIAAESHAADEGVPCRAYEEFDERDLDKRLVGGLNEGAGGLTIWKMRASIKVACLGTLGSTANDVSPTKPRVKLVAADWSIGSLRYGARNSKTRSTKEYMAQKLGAQ